MDEMQKRRFTVSEAIRQQCTVNRLYDLVIHHELGWKKWFNFVRTHILEWMLEADLILEAQFNRCKPIFVLLDKPEPETEGRDEQINALFQAFYNAMPIPKKVLHLIADYDGTFELELNDE